MNDTTAFFLTVELFSLFKVGVSLVPRLEPSTITFDLSGEPHQLGIDFSLFFEQSHLPKLDLGFQLLLLLQDVGSCQLLLLQLAPGLQVRLVLLQLLLLVEDGRSQVRRRRRVREGGGANNIKF